MKLTHFNEDGRARMVDVGEKSISKRSATATGKIYMSDEALALVREGRMKKGDVLGVAQVGGIMGSKKTSELIPMCHNIFISGTDIDFKMEDDHIRVYATVRTEGKTGVEMEALMAVNIALLTIYDMCKAVDKAMLITGVQLLEKVGGKSGRIEIDLDERG